MTEPASSNSLFSKFGVELEYMIVDRDTLDVRPIADEVLIGEDGAIEQEIDRGRISWSNELARHVIELKTTEPAPSLDGLADAFQREIQILARRLAPLNATLLPTAMHPWMNPDLETRLWPHGDQEIYRQFDRVFGCKGHGWSNLQSAHLNLPFANDDEFVRLHSAIRLVLPLIPAIAASSPFVEGRASGWMDYRINVYRGNCAKIPSISGAIVPEPVASIDEYHSVILEPIYRDIKPHDPDEILRDEWLNARGAIARFCRNTIEIRVVDVQECPAADIAILDLVIAVLRKLTDESWSASASQRAVDTRELSDLLLAIAKSGGQTPIQSKSLLAALGFDSRRDSPTAREVWRDLARRALPTPPEPQSPLANRLSQGSLAESLTAEIGPDTNRKMLEPVYHRLSEILIEGSPRVPLSRE